MKKITKILSAFVLVFACFVGAVSFSGCLDKEVMFIDLDGNIKTEYKLGESLDLNGAKLVLTYDDDTQNVLIINSEWITGFNTNTVGERKLTITYKEKTIEKTYTVVKTLESISLNGTIKTQYELGESLDLNGAKITLNYDNNTTEEVTLTANMITDFNTATLTESGQPRTLTIAYAGKTLTVDYSVSEININTLLTTAYNNAINSQMLKVSIAQTEESQTMSPVFISEFIKNNNLFKLNNAPNEMGQTVSGYICLSPFKTTLEECEATTNEQVFTTYELGATLINGITSGAVTSNLTVTFENGKYKIIGSTVAPGQSQNSTNQLTFIINSNKLIESINVVVNNFNISTTTTTITYSYTNVPQISYPA